MKKITALLLMALLLLQLASCGGKKEPVVTIRTPGETLELHTEAQAKYLDGELEAIDDYCTGRVAADAPAPFTVTWDGPDGQYVLMLQEQGSSEWTRYTTEQKTFTVQNLGLKTNTRYTLVVSCGEGEDAPKATVTFQTCAHGPRNLKVDKVDNVRDLGGWKTASGGSVKQGLVYRGGRLNQNDPKSDGTVSVKISQKGIDYMTNTLGIKTEIDLRDTDETGFGPNVEPYSVLGEQVKYVACPMKNEQPDYDPSVSANYASLKKCLEVFADPEAYPIYFHCSVGTDRTGYVAYLINGLLGVPKEDLLRDYLFSDFGAVGGSRHLEDIAEKYVAQIDAIPADTLSEQIRAYLTGPVGVSPETLDAIVANLTN